MTWSPGTIIDPVEMLKQLQPSNHDVLELIVCGYCNKLHSRARTRKILSEKDAFIGYRCVDCAVEGKPLP